MAIRVHHSKSAGWVTCRASDETWTHVIDSQGRVWTRAEHEHHGFLARGRKRYVRPKLHGGQLDLVGGTDEGMPEPEQR